MLYLHLSNQQRLRIDSVMVDLDGTMVDTVKDIHTALNTTLTELKLPTIAETFVAKTIGKGTEHLLQQTLLQANALPISMAADSALLAQAIAIYQQHYACINGQFSHVYPHVEEGLKALHQAGVPLACVTNKPLHLARDLLHRFNLLPYFVCVHGGDSFARKKPDPLPLLETAKILGTAPAHTLMIGDSANDAQAAHAAGCPVLLVEYGYNHGQPIRTVEADGYLASVLACVEILKGDLPTLF